EPITGADAEPAARTTSPTSRGWASAGILAGVLGIATFAMTGALVVETDALADNAQVAELLTDKAVWVWAYQVVGVATALLVAVFGTGLHRRLAQQSPAGSLAPQLSLGGLWLTAALTLVGSGICTELFHGLRQDTD